MLYNICYRVLFSRYGNDVSYFFTFHCNGQYSEIEPHFVYILYCFYYMKIDNS